MTQIKLPSGALGLIVSSTNEAQQEDLFFPCDPRLFAVNVAGNPECGSLVFDLNKANEPDSGRGAYLQSAFRVVKLPLGQPNAIAFQLDLTGKKDTQGGFFCEIMRADAMEMPPPPGASGPGKTVVEGEAPPKEGGFGFGEGSHNYGGPFHVGVKEDKHHHGVDADGNPINCLHIWTSANFFMNRIADGPIRFELEYKEGNEREFVVPCHLAWTGADWASWTTCSWYVPPGEKTTTPGRPTTGDRYRKLPPPLPGTAPLELLRPRPLTNPLDYGIMVESAQAGANTQPLVPSWPDVATPGVAQPIGDGREIGSGVPMNMVATLSAMVAPAMIARPENYSSTSQSTGLFDYAGGAGSSDPSQASAAANAAKADGSSPATIVASAFGAQGGNVDDGGSGGGTNYGGEGDPWLYTQTPSGQITTGKKMSKYPGGTAPGGIVYHPAETDLRDLEEYGMVPPNTTLSEVYVVVAPYASFGAGIPDLAVGSVKSGYSWSYDTDTGDLVFYSHSFTVKSEALRFTNPGQEISWKSGQDFAATFTHAHTAARTHTFMDVTANVAALLLATGSPAGAVTAPEGTFYWDTSGHALYVNNNSGTGWTAI